MRPSLLLQARAPPDWRKRLPQSSYYERGAFAPALERARRAYLFPNIVTGICVFSFAIGVYAYTIHAVSQDEFEDVPIPSGPKSTPMAPHASANREGGSVR